MHISEIRIRNFRSIEDMVVPLDRFTVFCGPNSCGKSNVFRAIQLAFQREVSIEDAQNNLTDSMLGQGGPTASIWVDCKLANIPTAIKGLAGTTENNIDYTFRVTRGGKVTRKLGTKVLSLEEFAKLLEHFMPLYVPPIRDLGADGLVPFKRLIKVALLRSKGTGNIKQVTTAAKKLLQDKATLLLDKQHDLVKGILHADKLSLDTSLLDIEALYENIGIQVHTGGREIPLSALGTGHQSAVIMHLYRQLGESMPGEVLYLFEEPDNHLHPSTIRSICDDLTAISAKSQVLVSTHSPVFLAHVGFAPLRPLVKKQDGLTALRTITLLKHYTEKQARAHLESHGLRLTEPLVCGRVIVVEGITDKVVLSSLLEKRRGVTADQADVLLISAGGKDKAVTLAHLLHCLGVEWRCVLDHDSAFSSEVPFSKAGLSPTELGEGIDAINKLKALTETGNRRGNGFIKTMNAVLNELTTARPTPTPITGSPLKTLIDKLGTMTAGELAQLRAALKKGHQKEARKLLVKANTFIWSGTMEEVMLRNATCEDIVEATLVATGELNTVLTGNPNRRQTLINKLHEAGNKPDVLAQVVSALEDSGCFNRTEVNVCFEYVFDHLE